MGRVVNNFHSSLLLVHSSLKSGFQKRQKSSKTNVALSRPASTFFVYFRYQNGNARLLFNFDFWCKPFYHMDIKPVTSNKCAMKKMTNAFRYLDYVPDFIECKHPVDNRKRNLQLILHLRTFYCLESVPKMLLVLSGEPG